MTLYSRESEGEAPSPVHTSFEFFECRLPMRAAPLMQPPGFLEVAYARRLYNDIAGVDPAPLPRPSTLSDREAWPDAAVARMFKVL